MTPKFSLTFGISPDSWEREHTFAKAASCFDYLVCTPDGRISAVNWTGGENLVERSFRIGEELLARLWDAVLALDLRPGITDLPSSAAGPSYFVRFDDGTGDRVLRTNGKQNCIGELLAAVDLVLDCDAAKSCKLVTAVDSPTKIAMAQLGWRAPGVKRSTL